MTNYAELTDRLIQAKRAGPLLAIQAADAISTLTKDRYELLEQLRFIRAHLYSATVQIIPSDDRIITDHVEKAYERCNEVIKEFNK